MQYFPIFLDLNGQDVLVVGGGTVAERKIRLLLTAGARVKVCARELTSNLRQFLENAELDHIGTGFDPSHLAGVRLAFAATDDARLNREVYRQAERLGVAVNVVDDTRHCRFISPAIVDRSPVQIAISTGGSSPVLARRLRRWIEQLLPLGLGKLAGAAGALRSEVKSKLPFAARRRWWEGVFNDRAIRQWSDLPAFRIESALRSRLSAADTSSPKGMVYLVGAGPGNPELLTLKALDVLGRADVILHDRLVGGEIMDLARRDADRIYVGKQAGNHHCKQEDIHRIMLEQARLGKTVVRLKGGDAFIFGRGGEELQVLADAGIPYEVVPGITAATACAAYAGIPLTHRDISRSLTFVTGHQAAEQGDEQAIDWRGIAGKGKTVAIYMGVKQAGTIRHALLEAGIASDFPATLIVNGSLEDQQVYSGTVGGIPSLAQQVEAGKPGLLIVGQVASLGRSLGWIQAPSTVLAAA